MVAVLAETDAEPQELAIRLGQFSSEGRKPVNQDFHGAIVPTGRDLFLKGIVVAIADGISSSDCSNVAAETAVKTLLTDYYCTSDAWSVKTSVSRVIAATNSWLHTQNVRAGIGDINRGFVCTFSALVLKGGEAHLFHIGDSRIYRMSGESLEPLTQDHRIVLSSKESYLGRAMGVASDVEIDHQQLPVARGDIFVLTTDGVHEHMDPRFVVKAIGSSPDLDQAAKLIAVEALRRGSDDNLTIQIVQVDNIPEGAQELYSRALDLPVPGMMDAGDVIDGYKVLRRLKTNNRSHIYLVTDNNGNHVVLKVPATETQQSADYLQRFVLEEWIARRVTNDHVLKAAPAPLERSALYTLTEFVEGATLRQWMTDNPRPSLDRVRDVIEQVARGLRAFHRLEMLHQDLRPENVMIDASGTVKIIDFGSTAVAGVEEAAPGVLGYMPGTYQYTAPEYLSGDTISWRSDQFSLGVLAYEMLSGQLPYGTQVARVRSRTDQRRLRYRSARSDDQQVPEWLDDVLRRATHPDPVCRFDALSEFVAALDGPGPDWQASKHVPLAQRDPVRFWQVLSLVLAIAVIALLLNQSS